MDRPEAIEQIKAVCKTIAGEMMKIHPAVPPLNDKTTQTEIYEAIYRITKDIEIIKKKVIKLQSGEETPLS
jgi:hypothetical protein